MTKTYENELMALMKQDTGRGLLEELPEVDLAGAEESLLTAKRAVILTGFPVRNTEAGQPRGETDGPSGTANLAAALLARGCQVWIVTDALSYPLLRAAAAYRAPEAQVLCVEKSGLAAQWLDRIDPTHVMALERPGRADDGHFYNMRGVAIDDMITDTEDFFEEAVRRGIPTIAVGDGGNELGMGNFRDPICRCVPGGELICAHQGADWTLPGGISNWWGWGVASMLSLREGRMLLPTAGEERALLEAVVSAGGVDGCTGRLHLSVDSMELENYLELLEKVRALTQRELESANR